MRAIAILALLLVAAIAVDAANIKTQRIRTKRAGAGAAVKVAEKPRSVLYETAAANALQFVGASLKAASSAKSLILSAPAASFPGTLSALFQKIAAADDAANALTPLMRACNAVYNPMTLDPFNEPLIPAAQFNPIVTQMAAADAAWSDVANTAPNTIAGVVSANPAVKAVADTLLADIAAVRAKATVASSAYKTLAAANKK